MRILLTGFDDFGGVKENPSWRAVQAAARRLHEAECVRLPVVYGEAGRRLLEAVREKKPDLVISCGAAIGRETVTPELLAINYRYARSADNAGSIQLGTPVDPGGSAAVMNSLPLAGIVETLRGEGLPCSLSVSAGSYVCNDLYYTPLSHQKELGYRGLFVHVPSADRVDPETAADILVRLIREIG